MQVKSGLYTASMTYFFLRDRSWSCVSVSSSWQWTVQSVELVRGRLYDKTAGDVTESFFYIHIHSVVSNYEDIVGLMPVQGVTEGDIVATLNQLLEGLTELDYTVASVTTDSYRRYG